MKVLISAYACEPGAGSESRAGWEWARAAGLENDVWLLTRENNAPPIEKALLAEPHLTITPVYLDLPPSARFWKRGKRGAQFYYLIWQILAWRKAQALNKSVGLDVMHHITFAGDSIPAGVAFVKGPRFVWGPVGGATRVPWRLWRWLGARGCVVEAVRLVVTGLTRKVIGEAMARRASIMVAQNPDVALRFARWSPTIEPHVVVNQNDVHIRSKVAPARIALFLGRLVPLKGLALAVAAVAEAPGWRLEVLGDGSERVRCERMAKRLGAQDRITFHGHRPRPEVGSFLENADVLIHPSLHEGASWAVAEALAAGLRVVCLDTAGVASLVDEAGVVVRSDAPMPKSLSAALDLALGAKSEATRWTDERLPSILRRWYSLGGDA